jgi:uncharacterized tellurite resistance protein B-like protein
MDGTIMIRIFLIGFVATLISVASPADARRGGAGFSGEKLVFVSPSSIPIDLNAPSGGNMSICHLVDTMSIVFVPLYTSVQSYVLSDQNCEGDTFYNISQEQFASFQAMVLIPADLPAEPKLSVSQLIFGHAFIIFVAMGLFFKLLINFRSRPRKPKVSSEAVMQTMAAMCHMSTVDGDVDENEIREISAIMMRLTGRKVSFAEVSNLLRDMQNDPIDPSLLGRDLKKGENLIVLEAALNIAVADGRMDPSEYALIQEIAQALRISGADFRDALARIAGHLSTPSAPTGRVPLWKSRMA